MSILDRNQDITLGVVLLLFIALALTYSVVNPLHEATDELRHYRFVRYIVSEHSLPVQGEGECRFQSHHPPLYYALGALATSWIETGRDLCATPPSNPFWAYRFSDVGTDNKNQYLHGADEAFPWHGEALAAHIIRALNVLIGAGTVWLTWATARTIWPRRPALALGGTAFVAFNPMFLYMAGAINNDVIAAFSGSAILLACVRLVRDPQGLQRRWGLILGALFGMALMSKFNMAASALLIAVAATFVAWKRKQWREWLEVGLLTVAVAALISGWWFVRNQRLYGEPTGFRTVTELWGSRDPLESIPLAIFELPAAWSSLWGRFGFGQIPLPELIYDLLAWLVLLGLLGVLLAAWRRFPGTPAILPLLLVLSVLLAFAVLFNYMLVSPAGAMGRFFFPGLPALGLLTFYGLAHTGSKIARRFPSLAAQRPDGTTALALALNGALLLLALVALFGYLAPAYARPPTYTANAEIPNQVNANFSGLATLRGYEFSTMVLQPGEPLDIDLYWEVNNRPPGNFLLFLHLIDEAGTVVAQRDTHPGTGTFPTSQWREGDRFVDSIRVYVPETAYTPTELQVSVGLYAPTYRVAIAGADGQPLGDALTLGTVQLLPGPQPEGFRSSVPNPTFQNFEDELALRGYSYNARSLHSGEGLQVTVYWQRLASDVGQHLLALQLLDSSGTVRSTVERPIPLQSWTAGEIQSATYSLALPADLEPGTYGVRLIVRDGEDGGSRHLMAPEGHIAAEHLDLAQVQITELTAGKN
jgi:4-amino-4-deoxy-L-arabinose transferase-like glycosyltransferase